MFQIIDFAKHKRTPNPSMRRHASSKSYNAKTRVYVMIDNESIMDNIIGRRNRDINAMREVVLDQCPELDGHIKWSRTAGCSCGCSPGFIADETLFKGGRPVDIFITARFS